MTPKTDRPYHVSWQAGPEKRRRTAWDMPFTEALAEASRLALRGFEVVRVVDSTTGAETHWKWER